MAHSGPHRTIGRGQLLFIAVSSMVGSSWLFASLYTSQQAGPAGVFSILLGGLIILSIATVFAELAGVFPLSGGSARLPHISHGGLVSYVVGFLNWIAYLAIAPLEVTALLEYTADLVPGLVHTVGTEQDLSATGLAVAIPLLLIFVVINYFGVQLLARINQPLAIWKLAVPTITVATFALSRFELSNFTAHGGFAPAGVGGILGAVTTGGAVVAYLGFRSVLELAGEVRNPRRDIPFAMLGGICFCIVLYALLDITFIGALTPSHLADGWAKLAQSSKAGPIAGIALQLGLGWLATVLLLDAVVSPGGTAMIYTGVAARVGRALTRNGLFPHALERLNRHGVPAVGLAANFVIGIILLLPFPGWQSLMGIITSAIVLSLGFGPISLLAFRHQFPDRPRFFRLPVPTIVCGISFILCSAVVYWAGWKTNKVLLVLVLIAFAALPILVWSRAIPASTMAWRSAIWVVPYFSGLFLLSWIGEYGGLGIVNSGIDFLALAILSLAVLAAAHHCRLSDAEAQNAAEDPEANV